MYAVHEIGGSIFRDPIGDAFRLGGYSRDLNANGCEVVSERDDLQLVCLDIEGFDLPGAVLIHILSLEEPLVQDRILLQISL